MFYKLYYTYILASDSGTFYIGLTGFLEQRVFQHKEKLIEARFKQPSNKRDSSTVRAKGALHSE
jgi:predicted GIY-YIG superfamily endonuclease